ncbi:MAG TPA: dihydrolipoamide acetyltransferase family protein [Rubrobacter sp.]|nr:dihydrolipoamide acetyltransferase family protein [Rubrobacter sp.]
MAKPVTMPQLGESVTEGTITRWLKAEGEVVEIDEPLAEVDTDKVNAELPSPVAGKIESLLVPEGTTVDVGTEIVLVADDDAPGKERVALADEFPTAETVARPAAEELDPVALAPRSEGNGRGEVKDAATLRRTRSSPVVRRLAAEHDVKIADIPGSGTGGRVTRKDIEGYIERSGAARGSVTEGPMLQRIEGEERAAVYEGDGIQDLTSIRRAIANRMATSKREAPHAWTMVEVDVSGLVALREREKAAFVEREGVKLTYLPFIVRAVVESLRENPMLNSVWDGDRIILRKRINIGVAVDLEDALIVPVIPDADELNITGLARRIDALVKRARAGELGTNDVSGGTFTVNNPGSLGSVVSTPIINHPQAAILSAEAIVKRPVVIGDAIAIRSMMNLEVSFDHRILDGGAALRFLNAVKGRLEAYRPEGGLG